MVETDLEISCRTYIYTLSEPEELMKGVRVKIGSATEMVKLMLHGSSPREQVLGNWILLVWPFLPWNNFFKSKIESMLSEVLVNEKDLINWRL